MAELVGACGGVPLGAGTTLTVTAESVTGIDDPWPSLRRTVAVATLIVPVPSASGARMSETIGPDGPVNPPE